MPFEQGDQVSRVGRADEIGRIISGPEGLAGQDWYTIDFGPLGVRSVPEEELQKAVSSKDIKSLLVASAFGTKEGLTRLLTLRKLTSRLNNTIYALQSSRTLFLPHQFKPILKFLDSHNQRLLIADEVGLGKTIEAGLILTELRARYTRLDRVLVVCPSRLCQKWKGELRARFDEEYRVFRRGDILEFVRECHENERPPRLHGIVSLETMRGRDLIQALGTLPEPMDMVIVDEAHHMRNTRTLSHQLGRELSEIADGMLLLSATPVQTGSEDLFRLLQILDREQFDNRMVFEEQLRAIEPILKAISALRVHPPQIESCREAVTQVLHGPYGNWFRSNPSSKLVVEKLARVDPTDRAEVIDIQGDCEGLNLMGRVLNRTKKRDVQEFCATREARVVDVTLTKEEAAFYRAVTRYVRARVLATGQGILAFAAMIPQRQMASSINAMVQYYRAQPVTALPGEGDPESWMDLDEIAVETEEDAERALAPDEALNEIVQSWPSDATDTKATCFLSLLEELEATDPNTKVLCFAYFKKTLSYLHDLLAKQGIAALLVSGDVHDPERQKRIDTFRDDPRIRVLLCSEVGSEGLDFQFCNTIVNYDLPWNPMKIEQRIGRIDRIGQESSKVRIINFSVEGTIEEKMLDRLYRRIGIFERSIGDLETILGERIRDLTWDLVTKELSDEQQAARIEQTARAIVRKRRDIEILEKNSAKLIGHDEYFLEEIERIRSNGRYVDGEELEVFVRETLAARYPRTRLIPAGAKSVFRLKLDPSLAQALRPHARENDALYAFISMGQAATGVECTFSQPKAYARRNVEFLTPVHPFVTGLVTLERLTSDSTHPVAEIHLKSVSLPPGKYGFFVWLLEITAARSSRTLESVIVPVEGDGTLGQDLCERVLGEIVKSGQNPPAGHSTLDPAVGQRLYRQAREELSNRIERKKAWLEAVNEGLIAARLESLNKSYGVRIERRRGLLSKATRERRDPRYIRMLDGAVQTQENRLRERTEEIEAGRRLSMQVPEIVGGILVVEAGG